MDVTAEDSRIEDPKEPPKEAHLDRTEPEPRTQRTRARPKHFDDYVMG